MPSPEGALTPSLVGKKAVRPPLDRHNRSCRGLNIAQRDGLDQTLHGFARGDILVANMTDEDVAACVDGTILNGEFATLQSIPEIAQALQQSQASAPAATGQTKPPEK